MLGAALEDHVRAGAGRIGMLRMGSSTLRCQPFYVNEDEPSALRAIEGHSVIEEKTSLMEWKKITASDAPRL